MKGAVPFVGWGKSNRHLRTRFVHQRTRVHSLCFLDPLGESRKIGRETAFASQYLPKL